MCTRRVSRYNTCPYRFNKTLEEKLCIKWGVIAPCPPWEWLLINELPNAELCPCEQCADAAERRLDQQSPTIKAKEKNISQ
ncbi:hypothetical protein KCU85_g2919, partial [Aureobasidium melanogenum]